MNLLYKLKYLQYRVNLVNSVKLLKSEHLEILSVIL